jgi:integrase/recombinase XerD
MLAEGRSTLTMRNAKSALKGLAAFVETLGVMQIEQLSFDTLRECREELAWRLTPKNTPLSPRSQSESLGHLRSFCRFLTKEEWILIDPSEKLPNPKKPKSLPKAIMEQREVEAILAMPDMNTARGVRDRVLLEVLYSTAIRREEVANIKIEDVDTEIGFIHIREGKGDKDRVVPVGESVCELIDHYLADIRPNWLNAKEPQLFLNRFGMGIQPMAVWNIVRKYVKLAGLEKSISPHTFRHSCATHMLRAGAPIRHLQEMLGHASLSTTQVYTRITINDLREAHKKFHPREQ